MKKWLISQMFKSKKFWYAIASIVVPLIVTYLGVDEETATKLFQAAIALIIGQGIADSGKK
jgi:lipoprotein signal peptidase